MAAGHAAPSRLQAHEERVRIAVDTFAEIYIMSRARCLLISVSGFSNMAVYWGGKQLLSCHKAWECCCERSATAPTYDNEYKATQEAEVLARSGGRL